MIKNFKALTVALIAAIMLVLPGCATLQQGNAPQTAVEYFERYRTLFQLATQVAVIKVLDPNPTYATHLIDFSEFMREVLETTDVVDLSELEQLVRDEIDWSKYQPTERLLVETLITTVRVEIENVLRANKDNIPTPPEDVKLIVGSFIDWVAQGARLHIEQQSTRNVIPVLPERG